MAMQVCVTVEEPSQVGEARRIAVRMGQQLAMPTSRQGDVAIVATELATNLARHAKHGQLRLQHIRSGGAAWLEMVAVDDGPGITDLHRSMQDGYSSAGTPGTGFGAIRRLSDEFDAFSTPGKGTVVLSRLKISAETRAPYVIGAACLPAPHEPVCGDTWRASVRERDLAVMLADGLGHGPLAEDAAQRAAQAFDEDPFVDDLPFYQHAHRQLAASRGAAMARAVIRAGSAVRYTGVGNIAATLVGTEASRGLPSQNGTVGVQTRQRILSQEYPWPARGLLIMHSDGINGRWSLEAYPGLLFRHPAIVAAVLARDFRRGRDDATAVVVRMAEGAPRE
jgi:anti-sigma regulatory factor (Ser/Thr protein kinase)